jgi:hypothetical protein
VQGCNGHSAVEHVRPFVESGSHGPEALEGVGRALHLVLRLYFMLANPVGPAARAAAAPPMGPLVSALGNGVPDPPTAQVPAIAAR